MPQDPEFVQSKDEIRDNVRRFQRELAANPDLAKRLVARIEYWVVDENEGSFAPAKLAVVRNGTLARYKSSRAHFTGGAGRAGAILNHILGTGYEKSDELDKSLAEWSTKHFGRVAIKARTFFIRVPSVERNAPKRTRETEPVSSERAPLDESRQSVGTPSKIQKNRLEDAYARFTPEQLQEIIPHHNRLSNGFQKWLASVGAAQIVAESKAVDVLCVHSDQSCLFELKTCCKQSSHHALREALGQILDYAFYPGRTKRNCLAVVLDEEPTEADIDWFHSLADEVIPVELFWLKGKNVYCARVSDHPLATQARQP